MVNNYDQIAKAYDILSRMLFFKSQVNAQIQQLHLIPAHSKVLIAGGGTGWILEQIAKSHPEKLYITYLEISGEMINLAKKRKTGKHQVEFIQTAVEDFNTSDCYDVIHTAFLFDNFGKEKAEIAFNKLHALLKDGGLWLFTDFSYQPKQDAFWKGLLLKLMYAFFSKIASVDAQQLIDTAPYFKNAQYQCISKKTYYSKFIKALVYQKSNNR
ncbi:class I SAM-dependent methyltransferase [Pedobacter sp.]|uniref:class I SAM-dependent methyltransferase n=1 Tax=Pedobacter sp. TaxID=1411316 RepID=UPI003D7FCB95